MGEADAKTVLNVEKTYSEEWVKNNIKGDEQTGNRMRQRALYPRCRGASCEREEENRTGK